MIFVRNSVGIEIGENDLTLAIARSSFGKVQLKAIHRIAGFSTLAEDERKKTLQALVKTNHIPTARVYLTLPREHGIVRQIDLPVDLGRKAKPRTQLHVLHHHRKLGRLRRAASAFPFNRQRRSARRRDRRP